MIEILSLRQNPKILNSAGSFLQAQWADEKSKNFYKEALKVCIDSKDFIPQFYFAKKDEEIIACAGVVLSDFVARVDLYPFFVALFVQKDFRTQGIATRIIKRAKEDCKQAGYEKLYLCSDLKNFYEKSGFSYLCQSYDVFGYSNSIYFCEL